MADTKYIDASVLDDRVRDSMNLATNPDPILKLMHIHDHKLFRAMIAEAPAVEMIPVVKGLWYRQEDEDGQYFVCNRCKCFTWHKENYCPNCGAKMDLEG